jgi:hypothetical protein
LGGTANALALCRVCCAWPAGRVSIDNVERAVLEQQLEAQARVRGEEPRDNRHDMPPPELHRRRKP